MGVTYVTSCLVRLFLTTGYISWTIRLNNARQSQLLHGIKMLSKGERYLRSSRKDPGELGRMYMLVSGFVQFFVNCWVSFPRRPMESIIWHGWYNSCRVCSHRPACKSYSLLDISERNIFKSSSELLVKRATSSADSLHVQIGSKGIHR